MKFRVIRAVTHNSVMAEGEDIEAWAAENGLAIEENDNMYARPELRACPKIEGLVGPFWDNGAVRYESREYYKEMI